MEIQRTLLGINLQSPLAPKDQKKLPKLQYSFNSCIVKVSAALSAEPSIWYCQLRQNILACYKSYSLLEKSQIKISDKLFIL